MEKKFKKEYLIWIIGILFAMSVFPGQGTKANNQQAVVQTEYACQTYQDCPTCVGGFLKPNATIAESDLTFFEELAYAKCVDSKCRLSEYCLVWDCGGVNETEGCNSVKSTILDNTLGKFNQSPLLLIGAIALIIGLIILWR